MNTITVKHFDALEYVKKSRELGVDEKVAEFQARQIEQAIEVAIAQIENKELATKSDIGALQKELVTAELRLVKWILGTGAATILAIAGLLKIIH
ncbi:MAG: hypothetical protein EKK54_06290 [Neisseriaceae bacterium]|nr:MAG: hypothetical protein EKK54_06290 [Neisseriaceae bacterium]